MVLTMSNLNPRPETRPEGSEGISTKAALTFVLVAAVVLFVVFFTWFQNTQNYDPNPNAPVSGTGSSAQ